MLHLKLEAQNVWKPTCPGISINPKKASWTEPQAWSHNIDGVVHWYYNWQGAMEEAEFLGKRIPTIEELMEILDNTPGDCEEKARVLGIPFVGSRNAGHDEFLNAGVYAGLWSSSEEDDEDARYAFLERGDTDARSYWYDRAHGMSLRLAFASLPSKESDSCDSSFPLLFPTLKSKYQIALEVLEEYEQSKTQTLKEYLLSNIVIWTQYKI